jgi:phosphomannomutase
MLLPADDMWTLLVWYRLQREIQKFGRIQEAQQKFLVLSMTTTDAIVRLARKHGIGVIRTWVGFAALAASTRDAWDGKAQEFVNLVEGRNDRYTLLCHPYVCDCLGMEGGRRTINIGAMEQSNGFSILGGPPPDGRSLGAGGHVRDKDGTFAALLVAEIAAWAKQNKTTIPELLDRRIYLDPEIGLFVNLYEPDPLDGEYPGIEGDRLKKGILRRALGCFQLALAGDLRIGGLPVRSAVIYRTGKYDAIYPATYDFQFPDEGVRFYFDDQRLCHLTVRPSGTGNSLRFHVQLHSTPSRRTLITEKARLRKQGKAIMDDIRKLLKAPRSR